MRFAGCLFIVAAMLPVGASAQLASRDEFDSRVIVVLLHGTAHFEPQPANAGRIGRERRGSRARMPSRRQVIREAEHIGGVARAHEGRGVGCFQMHRPGMDMEAAAAIRVSQGVAARAGRVGLDRGHVGHVR